MKKFVLLIALLFVVGGGILAGVAWGLGAETSLTWNNGFRLVSHSTVEFNYTVADFDTLDVRLDVTTITLREGNEFRVEGRHHGDVNVDVRNGVLLIDTPTQRRSWFNIGFTTGLNTNQYLTITVPAGTELAGTMHLGVGEIRVEHVALRNANIDTGVGEIRVTGALTGVNRFHTGVGEIRVNATNGGSDDFAFTTSTGVGQVRALGANTSGVGGNMSHSPSDPIGTIHADTGVGDIILDFSGTADRAPAQASPTAPEAPAAPDAPQGSRQRENRPSNPAISLEHAIELAYADIAARGINATFHSDSGMSWEQGQWVWELLFTTQGERMPLIEFYINVDDGSIVKFEWDD